MCRRGIMCLERFLYTAKVEDRNKGIFWETTTGEFTKKKKVLNDVLGEEGKWSRRNVWNAKKEWWSKIIGQNL